MMMNIRRDPLAGDAAALCGSWSSLMARQFQREWIAAGERGSLERASRRRQSGEGAAEFQLTRLGSALHRALFASRQPS